MACHIKEHASGRRYFQERFQVKQTNIKIPGGLANSTESLNNLPETIWPQITAINANTRTRNNTYYPSESLIGNPKDGSGYRSALFPYPIPFIRDHLSSPSPQTGLSSPVYGRAKVAKFISDGRGGGYTSMVFEISDPEAVFNILKGNWMTVSVGITSEELYCGICGADLIQIGPGGCGHDKGEPYIVGGQEVLGFWKVGPVYHQELSAVVVPSDPGAQIKNTDLGADGWKAFAESAPTSRFISLPTIKELRMNKLTLGELYGLSEEHPDYHMESKLSSKQRDTLPGNAFCGPDRTFPAHDHGHAAFGLSVLGRYKGPGDKEKIKDCLERKLGKKKESTNLVILHDEKTQVQIPVLKFSEDIEETLESLKTLNLTEGDNDRIKGLISYHAIKSGIDLPESLKLVKPAADTAAITLEINESTYPMLYHTIPGEIDTDLIEQVASRCDSAESALIEAQSKVETSEQSVKELTEQKSALELKVTELETKLAEVPTVVLTEGAVIDESALTEAKSTIEVLTSQNEVQQDSIRALQEHSEQLEKERHEALALNVAIFMKLARRRAGISKDVTILAQEAAKRTRASLQDQYTELYEELAEVLNTGVTAPAPNSIPNPVLTENTQVELDPNTGKPVVNVPIEEQHESTYLVGLIDQKLIEEQIKRERARTFAGR
jgi:hypothetical protein